MADLKEPWYRRLAQWTTPFANVVTILVGLVAASAALVAGATWLWKTLAFSPLQIVLTALLTASLYLSARLWSLNRRSRVSEADARRAALLNPESAIGIDVRRLNIVVRHEDDGAIVAVLRVAHWLPATVVFERFLPTSMTVGTRMLDLGNAKESPPQPLSRWTEVTVTIPLASKHIRALRDLFQASGPVWNANSRSAHSASIFGHIQFRIGGIDTSIPLERSLEATIQSAVALG